MYGPTVPDPSTFALFAAASLAFLVIPGPSVVYIVTRSLVHGRRAGLTSALGVQAGGLLHVLGAAIGVSAVIASSATAFSVVKYAGAAYLIVVGVRKLLANDQAGPDTDTTPPHRLFWHGALVNALNPKTALFFLAFLPQFVDPAAGAVAPQMLGLGALFLTLATLSDGTYALLAAGAGRRLRGFVRSSPLLERLSGGVFVGLGVAAALAGEPRRR